MTKNEIANVLSDIGTLLELKGENPFKVRAYQSGARALEAIEESELAKLIEKNELQSVKGIGEALGKKVVELHTTGRLEFFEKLKASVEPGLVELLQIPGLGPKKIRALRDKLGVTDIAALTQACTDGRVAELDGFGAKTQEKLLAGIKNREAYGRRHLWWDAAAVAESIVKGLRELPQVRRAEAAGSLRRGLETVGDLDFIVAATEVPPVVDWFVSLPGIKEVTAKGETKASVRFGNGLQADLRLVPDEQFVFALHHFTGSKDHNVQMRQRALARGLSLSEWGLVPAEGEGTVKEKAARGIADCGLRISDSGKPETGNRRPDSSGAVGAAGSGQMSGQVPGSAGLRPALNIAGGTPALPGRQSEIKTEAELFRALGLHFIPPELREGMGEIEVAEKGELPRLVEYEDLRGAFHNHTTASDGRNTLAEMIAAADALGWEYLGIADHSKSSFVANGLNEDRLVKQVAEIRGLNASKRFRTHVFAGVECDILPDGSLDFSEEILTQLDYVVASVHNVFTQEELVMTSRIIRALEHPCTMMLGHLTGRLLLRREPYRVDVAKVIDAALANGVIIELNAHPNRLDLDWRHWKKAAERGLLCSINPDAHDTAGLGHVRAGINTARKGWLRREQILNTWPLAQVREWMAARSQKHPKG
ncbi:MAG: helix-hairpin-helix domain-containing protein [Opitutaceae bacterium]|nr:helix-hairpin-helix domain-containing protein [Opitutaceae bacterium]